MNTWEITSSWSSPCEPELFFHSRDGQDFCFTRSHAGWPSDPEPCCGLTNSTEPGVTGGLPPSTPDIRLALPMLCLAVCLQPRSGSAAGKTPNSTRSLNREAWKAAEVRHTTLLEASLSFCELKGNKRKQLTFFNVNVSCLLPTAVSDTLNVPFSLQVSTRSSRVLLQEI